MSNPKPGPNAKPTAGQKPAPPANSQPPPPGSPPANNWKENHAKHIESVKTAKAVHAHLAAGGNPAELPANPMDTSDYVQCPHCGRKFNQTAAEKHIPACEHMIHNKPGGGAIPPNSPKKNPPQKPPGSK